MPNYKKTKAIVLRRENIGEADRRIIFFTKDLGKISAIARGARKLKSKLSGHLELFNLIDLTLANHTIIGAKEINRFEHLRNNLQNLEKASEITELVKEFSLEHKPDKELFHLLVNTLSGQNGLDLDKFKRGFLRILGFEGANVENIKPFLRNNLL